MKQMKSSTMVNMKKLVAMLLTSAMILCMAACGDDSMPTETKPTQTTQQTEPQVVPTSPATQPTENPLPTEPAHVHEWKEATCTEPKTCSGCGEAEGEALGHNWQDATCTEPKTCSTCALTEGEVLEHTWDDGVVLKEATEEADGEMEYTCKACGEKKTQAIPSVNHEHDYSKSKVTKPTCTEEGYTTYTCKCGDSYVADKTAATGHAWMDATCTQPKTCAACGATEGDTIDHDWAAATCTAPKTCKICGATEGATTAHDWAAATCTEAKTCKTCGATEGTAKGHTWNDATCTAPKTCTICGVTEGNALGHDWAEATTTEPKTCKRCGKTEGDPLANDVQESESNDSSAEANKIHVNANCYGSISDDSDNDWYVVTLPEDGYITIQFEHPVLDSSSTYWELCLYYSDGETEVTDYWRVEGTKNLTTAEIGLPAGTYYIEIWDWNFDDSTYTLRVNHTASDVWETESNDFSVTADEIAVNTDYYGNIMDDSDNDWYVVTLPEDGFITIQFEHPVLDSSSTYWELRLYYSDGETEVTDYWSIEGTKNLTTAEIGLPAGAYYIEICDWNFDNSIYTLRVNHTASDMWETESNNFSATADEIAVNTDYYGNIMDDSDNDWYVVTLPEDGFITIQFEHPVLDSSSTYWELRLYYSDGETEVTDYWRVEGTKNLTTAEIGLPAGAYYIEICDWNSDDSTYTLCVDFTAVTKGD